MSECVVRMEMNGVPDCCGLCDPLFAVVCATKHDQTIDKMMLRAGRPSWCPIICSLPEGHGRLVDADALLRDIEKYHVSEGKFQHWLELQPTIVPAERS